jgi:hypothetical protein
MSSVRRAANRVLRAKRRVSGIRPPWPGLLGRWRWAAAARNPGLAVQLAILAAWIGAFVGGSYLPGIPHGLLHLSIAEATTALLSVLWQVQATSVGLVFTVVVFVFGFRVSSWTEPLLSRTSNWTARSGNSAPERSSSLSSSCVNLIGWLLAWNRNLFPI